MRKSNCYLKSQTKVSIIKNGRRPSEDRKKERKGFEENESIPKIP